MRTFRDASAVITGGGSGIGRALGSVLVEQGAHVVLADIDGEAAQRAAAQLAGPGSAVAAVLDVRDADAVRAVARNRAIVVEPRTSKALWRMQRLSPGLMDRAARMTLRRVQNG